METTRWDVHAIAAGVFAAIVIAALIAGRELARVRVISLAYGHSYQDEIVVFVLVVASTFTFAALALVALSRARGEGAKLFVVVAAIVLSFFASLPVYWYVYRDAPAGMHINISGEHRWAQPAGIVAALLTYGLASLWRRLRSGAAIARLPN